MFSLIIQYSFVNGLKVEVICPSKSVTNTSVPPRSFSADVEAAVVVFAGCS